MAVGDFSTVLEMTRASKRFEESGLRFEEYGDNPERALRRLDGQSSDDQMSDSETMRPQTSDRERRFEDRGLR